MVAMAIPMLLLDLGALRFLRSITNAWQSAQPQLASGDQHNAHHRWEHDVTRIAVAPATRT